MALKLQPPALLSGDTAQQTRQLYNYLYQMAEQLNVALGAIEGGRVSVSGGKAGGVSGGISGGQGVSADDLLKTRNELRSLILKTANTIETGIADVITDVEVQYALSSSVSEYTGTEADWSPVAPQWTVGKFMWTRTVTEYKSGRTVTSAQTCIAGARGQDGTGVTILGSYETEAELIAAHPTGNQGDAYLVAGDLYVWNGAAWEDVGTIQGPQGQQGIQGLPGADGADGQPGEDGVGIASIVPQYYLSNSDEVISGGSWSETEPEWERGKYIWTRSFITWTNGATSATTPVLAGAINKANEVAQDAADGLDTALNVDIPNNYLDRATYSTEREAMIAGFRNDFLAKSDYGELAEEQRTAIMADVNGLITAFGFDSRLNALDEQAAGFAEYRLHSEQYIRMGIVGYEDGIPIAGVVVGNNLTTSLIDGKEIVTSESMYGCFTAGQLSFWKNGQKVGYLSNNSLFITNIDMTGRFTMDGWQWDTSSGLSLTWVGRS